MKPDWETIGPPLVHVQANLAGDLSLEALGGKAGLSPFHLQKVFRAVVGETPKAYASRLRLERAAFYLLVTDCNLLEIALESGYRSHETFLRAFRRHFGRRPASTASGRPGSRQIGTRQASSKRPARSNFRRPRW